MAVRKQIRSRELCGDLVLGSHSDFVNELSIVEELLHCEGNIHIRTVICMPNTAGQGIEYCNGKAKYYFWDINEHHTTNDFREKVVTTFSSSVQFEFNLSSDWQNFVGRHTPKWKCTVISMQQSQLIFLHFVSWKIEWRKQRKLTETSTKSSGNTFGNP